MKDRVAVLHQGFVPRYRERFFELLAASSDIEYVVFHGAPPGRAGHRGAGGALAFPNERVRNRELSVGGRSLVYQPVMRRVLDDSFAGAVLGAELKLVSNIALWSAFKARRRPAILWGQGGEKADDRGSAASAVGSAGNYLKTLAARHADGYLVYTETGARRLVAAGVAHERIAVVRNTIDVEREIVLHQALGGSDEQRLRTERGLGAESVVLIYVGRLYREKRVPELIAAVSEMRARGVTPDQLELVILGDGPESERVHTEADEVEGVHARGAVYDREEVATYLRLAAALVIPGKVGLAANHAFAHGVPVVTRESMLHAPEIEYVEHGRNGLIVPGDERAFVEALLEVAGDRELRMRLSAGALDSRRGLTLAGMVQAFDAGVRRALDERAA